jgi:hypothetical protein
LPDVSLITLNMTKVVHHIRGAARADNTERLDPVAVYGRFCKSG